MQYFTFLGTGTNNQYDEAIYYFENNKENMCLSRYVQSAIIEKYQKSITEVYVFCTKKSYDISAQGLTKEIKDRYNIKLKFIEIEEFVKSEEIIHKMDKVLKEDFMIDVTHSFRNIPIAVTMISNYLEMSKNKQMLHLFYGNYNKITNEGIIIDMIGQYNSSKIASALDSFNRYLKVSDTYLLQFDDKKIDNLIKGFKQFNHMLEYCEFDTCIYSIEQIYNYCQSILKQGDEYILLVPYLKSIQEKLSDVYHGKTDIDKKVKFIQLLMEHDLVQLAITFTDQLIREELIHFYYFPQFSKFKEELMNQLQPKVSIYDLSQDLLFTLNLRNSSSYTIKDKIAFVKEKYFQSEKNHNKLNIESIEIFYTQIRNVVNHGGRIDKKIDVKEIINDCIMSVLEFSKEG